MMNRIFVIAVFIFHISCSHKEQFPGFTSEKVNLSQVRLLDKLKFQPIDTNQGFFQNESSDNEFRQLAEYQKQYFNRDETFDFDKFCLEWTAFVSKNNHLKLNAEDKIKWFNINGTLLQITGDAKYAEEMENTLQSGFPEYFNQNESTDDLVAPFIYTKNIDQIFVNLFTPAEISFEHSMFGKVTISQEFPVFVSDSMYIKFNMEIENYIELFVRIPSWTEGATVTVKNVKYFAPPGGYCKIAKEWIDGDVVEIYLPKKAMVNFYR